MHQAKAQIIRTFQLFIVAACAATIWLWPAAEAREARLGFLCMWWSTHGTMEVNRLDSTTIWTLPLQEAAKKSWWYRCKKNWTITDLTSLKALPGMDTLFVTTGNFDFTPMPQREKQERGSGSWEDARSSTWQKDKFDVNAKGALERIDLNEADSLALIAAPGIGPWSARAILRERARWGYFSAVAQLKNIHSLNERWQSEWDSLFFIIPRPPQLNLNTSTFADLNDFSGFRFHQVKKIVFYREQFGPVSWRELVQWEEFSDVDTTFLQHYVSE
jgi:DNA uptake protein ComE-like DNA-binding protein